MVVQKGASLACTDVINEVDVCRSLRCAIKVSVCRKNHFIKTNTRIK